MTWALFVLCACGFTGGVYGLESSSSTAPAPLKTSFSGSPGFLTTAVPAGYYDGNQTCSMTDGNLTAANIKSGIQIFGVTGTMTELYSNMARESSATQLSQNIESITDAGTNYTNSNIGYRAVPNISKDHDGSTGVGVTFVDRTGWGATTCGLVGTLNQRIADCAANGILGPQSTWDGSTKGHGGEGSWKLVTRTGDISAAKGREVWRDEKTMLLWSSAVSTSLNWCKASGSNNIAGNPTAENDADGICNIIANQNVVGLAVSACFEDGGINFTDTDASIDNAGKAGLGLASVPVVAWRLPTANDYMLASIHGLRFVIPDRDTEWTATTRATGTSNAHMISTVTGVISLPNRANLYSIRCVGR